MMDGKYPGHLGGSVGVSCSSAPPTPAPPLADLVLNCIVHFNNASNSAHTIEGKLFGFMPVPAEGKDTVQETPPIRELLIALSERLQMHAELTERILNRL